MSFEVRSAVTCPSCGGPDAEPEQDGDVAYFVCAENCGFEFGWHRITTQNTDEHCAVGIPEAVRRRASAPAEHALAASQPPLLQIGKRPS